MRRSTMILLALVAGTMAAPLSARERILCCGLDIRLAAEAPLPTGGVFEGRVVAIRAVDETFHGTDVPLVDVDFEVHRWWQHRLPRIVTVRSALASDCGLTVFVGAFYLVAPHRTDDGRLTAYRGEALSLWSDDAPLILSRLGEGREPRSLARVANLPDWRWRSERRRPWVGPDVSTIVTWYSVVALLVLGGLAWSLRHGNRRYGRGPTR